MFVLKVVPYGRDVHHLPQSSAPLLRRRSLQSVSARAIPNVSRRTLHATTPLTTILSISALNEERKKSYTISRNLLRSPSVII